MAQVRTRIHWTGCRGCTGGESYEEMNLHLARVDGRWKIMFSGPTNLE